jgi:hypothetical protein
VIVAWNPLGAKNGVDDRDRGTALLMERFSSIRAVPSRAPGRHAELPEKEGELVHHVLDLLDDGFSSRVARLGVVNCSGSFDDPYSGTHSFAIENWWYRTMSSSG